MRSLPAAVYCLDTAGQLSIRIDRKYPVADAAQAHAAFEQRQISGRVLLVP